MDYEHKRRKVEKLLHGKYPFSWAPRPLSPPRASAVEHEIARFNRAEHDRQMQEIDAERRSLLAKTDAEIDAAFDAYLSGLRERGKLDAENKERTRFFNLPSADADIEYWSKVEFWTLDESIALLLGKSPEVVNWDSVSPLVNVSAFAKQYERLRNLALRATAMNRGQTAIYPDAVMAWANDMEIVMPRGLVDAFDARRMRATATATARTVATSSQVPKPSQLPDALEDQNIGPTGASDSTRPMQALAAQEDAVVAKLIELGYSPLTLPNTEPGLPGVKALVRKAVGTNSLFQSPAVFNKAWQRLRDAKRIAEVHGLRK